jgi:phage shock protein C
MNRLYRSHYDKKLFGVCGGLAQYLRMDPTLIRLGFVIVAVFTGVPILLYFLMALVTPKEPLWPHQGEMFADDYFPRTGAYLDQEIEHLEKRALQQEVYRLRSELAKLRAQ